MFDFTNIKNRGDLSVLIESIDPVEYAKTRNYLSGSVTGLSPFFTHGVLQPVDVIMLLKSKFGEDACAKLYSEFGWREYFQRVWQAEEKSIFEDVKEEQSPLISGNIPEVVINGETGIRVIDSAINELSNTGYMHNHSRMWLASIITNIGQTHWKKPADWMFYHLLDGDPASNYLSWQWVAGTFSNKKYIANQENLNRFSGKSQRNTFLDVSYEELATMEVPQILESRLEHKLVNQYPESDHIELNDVDVLLYSIWNLDADWLLDEDNVSRVLLIEPSIYDSMPMSPKRWNFILHWAYKITGMKVFVGEIDELLGLDYRGRIRYREHPLCKHWVGEELPRKWIFPETSGYFPSFSKFWKIAQKQKT